MPEKEAVIVTLTNTFLREVGAISRIIQFTSDTAFKRFSLQKGQFMFLTRVCENPGINLAQLASLVHVDKTTATKAVQKLIRTDYLTRGEDPRDKRSAKLFPTALGLTTYDKVLGQENEYLGLCLKDMSGADLAQLNRLVAHVSANLEEVWQSLK